MDKTVQQILVQLEKGYNDSRQKHYEKIAMQPPYFSAMMSDVNALAKTYAKQTELGIALFNSEHLEARLLATKIIVPKELSVGDINIITQSIFRKIIADEWVDKVISKRKDCLMWEEKWRNEDDLLKQRLSWGLLLKRVTRQKATVDELVSILDYLENSLVTLQEPVRWKANHVLVEIGVCYPELRQRCIMIGETLGLYSCEIVSKGCTRSYAPEWIEAKVKLLSKRHK